MSTIHSIVTPDGLYKKSINIDSCEIYSIREIGKSPREGLLFVPETLKNTECIFINSENLSITHSNLEYFKEYFTILKNVSSKIRIEVIE